MKALNVLMLLFNLSDGRTIKETQNTLSDMNVLVFTTNAKTADHFNHAGSNIDGKAEMKDWQ